MALRGPEFRLTLALSASLLLAGCAAPSPAPPGPVALVPQSSPASAPLPPPSATADSVLGTPFLWAIKLPGCAASLLAAGPTAAAYTLADQGAIPPEQDWREEVDRAVDTYCGPPYAVPP